MNQNPSSEAAHFSVKKTGVCIQKLRLFSRHEAEAFTVFDWASATRGDKRRMHDSMVLTFEPFLSRGGRWITSRDDDDWTLFSAPVAPVVQYENTVVATRCGAINVT